MFFSPTWTVHLECVAVVSDCRHFIMVILLSVVSSYLSLTFKKNHAWCCMFSGVRAVPVHTLPVLIDGFHQSPWWLKVMTSTSNFYFFATKPHTAPAGHTQLFFAFCWFLWALLSSPPSLLCIPSSQYVLCHNEVGRRGCMFWKRWLNQLAGSAQVSTPNLIASISKPLLNEVFVL